MTSEDIAIDRATHRKARLVFWSIVTLSGLAALVWSWLA